MDITLDTTPKHRHLLSPRSRSSTFHPPGAPVLPDSLSCSLAEARASCDGRCGRFPRCWSRFLRCRLSSSPASPGSTGSESVDGPAEVSPGEGGGIGSRRLPAQGGRAGSPWSTSRARIRGLSIVLGSPPPPPAPPQARGGVALLVADPGGPAATATGGPSPGELVQWAGEGSLCRPKLASWPASGKSTPVERRHSIPLRGIWVANR